VTFHVWRKVSGHLEIQSTAEAALMVGVIAGMLRERMDIGRFRSWFFIEFISSAKHSLK